MAADAEDLSSGSALLRPMLAGDLAAAERITAHAYAGVDEPGPLRTLPAPPVRTPERASEWTRRAAHLLATDPGGCWVVEVDDEVVGVALSFTRELTWFLASYAVAPGRQGQGLGAQLLAAAMEHGRGCLRGMLNSSADPAAARRYRLAGFDLHPTMSLRGVVDRRALPTRDRARVGDPVDRDLMDSVDRRARGSAHGPDHEILAEQLHVLVAEDGRGTGYAYVDERGNPAVVAATSRRTAADLLWAALAMAPPGEPVLVRHVTAANQWAVDVGLAAGLSVLPGGYQALRHLRPPAPYLPHRSLM